MPLRFGIMGITPFAGQSVDDGIGLKARWVASSFFGEKEWIHDDPPCCDICQKFPGGSASPGCRSNDVL